MIENVNRLVLLIDDEPDIVEMLSNEMKERNIPCLGASDGRMALEMIEQHKPAVIVSDYKMPGLNGIELLQFLRNLGNRAPVIWITGYADAQTASQAWSMGIFHLFEKPVDPRIVGNEVEKALSITPEQMLSFKPTYLTDALREKHFQKLQIEIDKELYEKAKKHCLDKSMSMNKFILDLISKAVK